MPTWKDIRANNDLREEHDLKSFKSHAIQSQYSASPKILAISESMQEYSEKFKTVEAGLSGVFNELNQGLNQYTTTVSSGTKEFLTSYTSSIEKATNSLANAIQEHTDLTDELKEIVESIKK